MDYFIQFEKHLINNDYPSFLTLWEEYCMGDQIDPNEFKKILGLVKGSSFEMSFGRHVEQGISIWKILEPSHVTDEILELLFDLQTTNSEELADVALKFAEERYGQNSNYNLMMRQSGLRDRQSFQGAIRILRLLNHLKVGNFVYHTSGWGVGEIMEVSFIREQISLDFDYVATRKDLSFKNAFNTLIPLSDDHFLSRRFGNPDSLEEEAKKDPIGVIRLLLRDLGPKTATEMKDELCDLVIPEPEWAKWWQSARTKIKKDTMIEPPEDLQSPFRLREKEVSHEERLKKALEKKPNANTLIQMVYNFLRDFSSITKNKEFTSSLATKLSDALASEELSDGQTLQIHFFLQDLQETLTYEPVVELIKRFGNIEDVIKEIDIIAFKKRALVETRKLRDDWSTIFLNLLLTTKYNPIRDYILTELLDAKLNDPLKKKLSELLAYPSRFPNAFMWYFQKIMRDGKLPLGDEEGKCRFFESFLILLNILEQSPEQRDIVKKMHGFMTNGRFNNVRKIFQKAPKEVVQEFLLLATKCHSIEEHDIKILHSLAEVVHPSLSKLRKSRRQEEEEVDHTIWTTEEGYRKIKERIHQIATVETVEIAKEIEEARSHGDLRENAEYKFACEKRDRLQSELKMLSAQFNQARILTPNDIKTDSVGVGVIVDCKDPAGNTISYTILGPWEADPDKNILSFQSKLAQEMEHKHVGNKIEIQGKEMTLTQIRSFFD